MTEKERADFYQAHKDDPEIWGDAEPAVKPKQRKNVIISVRLTAEENDLLREMAWRSRRTYGAVMRSALKEYASPTPSRVPPAPFRFGPMPTTSHNFSISGATWTGNLVFPQETA